MDAHDSSGPLLEVANRRPGGWVQRALRALFVMGLVGGITGAAAGVGAYVWFAQDLPPLENFETMETYQPTRFEAADGQLVGQWSDGKQIAVRWDQLPRELILALIAEKVGVDAFNAQMQRYLKTAMKGTVTAVLARVAPGAQGEAARRELLLTT